MVFQELLWKLSLEQELRNKEVKLNEELKEEHLYLTL